MDYILFAISIFYFVKGIFKGFASMIFSLISVFVIVSVAWSVTQIALPYVEDVVQAPLINFLSKIINEQIPGEFVSVSDLESQISFLNFSIIEKILGDLTFEGSLTAGQILSPSLSALAIKAVMFFCIYFLLSTIIKIIKIFVNKFVNVAGLGFVNRVLGGIVGLVKGLSLFAIVYLLLNIASNIFLIEGLKDFIQEGEISNGIYNWLRDLIF